MTKTAETPRTRDREATEQKIIDAAKTLLVRDGFPAIGVNAVAREAGVDKQLIYRYFDNLDGLLEKLGQDLDFWMGRPEGLSAKAPDYASGVTALMQSYMKALRANAPTKQVLASELVDNSKAVKHLGEARSRAVQHWIGSMREKLGHAPEGVDAPAINALLLAAIHHLALRENATGDFAGLDLTEEKSWARIEKAIERLAGTLTE